METVISIIKFSAISQLVLILILIFAIYLQKILSYFFNKTRTRQKHEIDSIIKQRFAEKSLVTSDDIEQFNKRPFHLMTILLKLRKETDEKHQLISFEKHLSDCYLKPKARKLVNSFYWSKRYLAARFYQFGFDEADNENIIKLINDKIMLVAINAAIAAVRQANAHLINELINIFAKSRKLPQAIYTEVLRKDSDIIALIVENRLAEEKDVYTKCFCYRLLCKSTIRPTILSSAFHDVKSSYLDLKIAALEYIMNTQDENKIQILYQCAQDAHWEVRAVAAKLLTTIPEDQAAILLSNMLNDKEWWVRLNAAIALFNKGSQGINILKSIQKETNQFGYEIAHLVLND